MISAPCKDCKDRFLGCHDSCKKYTQYKKDVETEKKNKEAALKKLYGGQPLRSTRRFS